MENQPSSSSFAPSPAENHGFWFWEMAHSGVSGSSLFGKGSWGSLLCATRAESDQLQGGPSVPFPALGILSTAGTTTGSPGAPPLRRSSTAGPGRALPVESDLQPSRRPQERSQPRGTRCRLRGNRDSCGAQAPGSAPHVLLQLGVHLALPLLFSTLPLFSSLPLHPSI